MNTGASAVAIAVLAALAGVAHAAATPRVVPLGEVVSHIESRYGGEVVAIAFDDGGDKAAHYHVDVRYPLAGTAKLDVDAATLAVDARLQPLPEEKWTTSLAGAAAYAATHLGGQVLNGELDSVGGASAHYDIDVRLVNGAIARVKVDPRTTQMSWRTPPVVAD